MRYAWDSHTTSAFLYDEPSAVVFRLGFFFWDAHPRGCNMLNHTEQRYFEDFEVGEVFTLPSRTMTEALFAAFQLASGDNHPIHYDVEYCRQKGFDHMLAHGFQVVIQTADRKSTRLNSSHVAISYAVFCLKKKKLARQ